MPLPPTVKTCPKCQQVFDVLEYGKSRYCHACWRTYINERRARKSLMNLGVTETEALEMIKKDPKAARRPTTLGGLRYLEEEKQIQAALGGKNLLVKEFPFPAINIKRPGCECCWGRERLTELAGKRFCWRCAYYVSQCGRCLAHARREYIPALLARPDPPLLEGDADTENIARKA